MSDPFASQVPTSPTTPRSPLPAAALDHTSWAETMFTPANRQPHQGSRLSTQLKEPEVYYRWSGRFPHCKLYRYRLSALECLPAEIKLMVLGHSADIPSLHGLIRASPLYYQAFLSAREEMLTSTILQELISKRSFRRFRDIARARQREIPHRFQYGLKQAYSHRRYDLYGGSAFGKLYDHVQSGALMTFNVQEVRLLRKDWRMLENNSGHIKIRMLKRSGLYRIADFIKVPYECT